LNKTLELFHGGNIPRLLEAKGLVYFTAGFHTAQEQGEQVIKIELPITPTGRPAGKWETCFEKVNAGTYVFDMFRFKLNKAKHDLDTSELNEFQILYPKKEAKMNSRNLKNMLYDVGYELIGQQEEEDAIITIQQMRDILIDAGVEDVEDMNDEEIKDAVRELFNRDEEN